MKVCGIVLIVISLVILLLTGFFKIGGFGLFLQVGLPIGMSLLPLNDTMMGWLESPFPLAISARVLSVTPLSAFNGSVGGGEVKVGIDLMKWTLDEDNPNEPKLTEVIYIQESQEIDEIQRYKIVLSKIQWSLLSLIGWILAVVGFFVMISGVCWKLISMKGSPQPKEKLVK